MMLKRVFKRETREEGLAGMVCGKIKGGREVRIRLSQRMLELLSDFLVRIMEHSLKKAFARDRDTRPLLFSLSLSTVSLTRLLLPLARTRYLPPPPFLFFHDFSFVLSNENSKLLADEKRQGRKRRNNRR